MTEFRLGIPDVGRTPLTGDKARDLLWAKGGAERLPPLLWWRQDDRSTINGYPEVRWGGGKGCIRIYAVTDRTRQLLLSHIGALCELLREITQAGAVKLEMLDHRTELSIGSRDDSEEPLPGAAWRRYQVTGLVPTTRYANWQKLANAAAADQRASLERTLFNGIQRQAEAMGLRTPSGSLVRIPKDQQFTIVPVRTAAHATAYVPKLRPFSFYSNLDLTGQWAAGCLTSKGHGRISRDRHQAVEAAA